MAQQARQQSRTTAAPPTPEPSEEGAVPVPTMSPTLHRFAPAFVRVQRKLEPVTKRAVNPHFGNNFADLASILEEALPILGEEGFALMQFPSSEGRTLALMSMLIHESGEFISATMPLLLQKNDPQGEGSAITYGRRYAACAILGIRTADDDGNAGSAREDRPARQRQEAPRGKPQEEVSKEVQLGWADAAASAASHGAVSAQIKALNLPDDHPFRTELKAYRDQHGWPMTPDALTALSMMVAKVTSPAPQQAPPAPADGTPPEAPAPAPEAPSAQSGPSGETMPWDGMPPAGATPENTCWYCEKPMLATSKTVIIGGQDADHPAQRMHESCYEERQAELESDSAEDAS